MPLPIQPFNPTDLRAQPSSAPQSSQSAVYYSPVDLLSEPFSHSQSQYPYFWPTVVLIDSSQFSSLCWVIPVLPQHPLFPPTVSPPAANPEQTRFVSRAPAIQHPSQSTAVASDRLSSNNLAQHRRNQTNRLLMQAVQNGDWQSARTLLANRFDFSEQEIAEAMELAAVLHHENIFSLLLARNVKIQEPSLRFILKETLANGRVENFQTLLIQNMPLLHTTWKTLLVTAIDKNKPEMLNMLLEKSPELLREDLVKAKLYAETRGHFAIRQILQVYLSRME